MKFYLSKCTKKFQKKLPDLLFQNFIFLFQNILSCFRMSFSVLERPFLFQNVLFLFQNVLSCFRTAFSNSGSHQAVITHQTVILIHLILSSLELHCTLYYITVTSRYTEALKLHCFLKKNPLQYIGINLTKCGFELHGFFLEPKTAYLEALLYIIF